MSVFFDGHFDSFGQRKLDRMRKTKRKVDGPALEPCSVTDPYDVKFSPEASGHSDHRICEQRPSQTPIGTVPGFALTQYAKGSVLLADSNAG